MIDLLQPGQHPDADQLSAFAEHVLPPHEHAETLAHLAVCPDCRSVVALALPPLEPLPAPEPARRPWLSGWNLFSGWSFALPAGAALAALLAVAFVVHSKLSPNGGKAQQVADARTPAPPVNAPAPIAAPAQTQQAPAEAKAAARTPGPAGGIAIKSPTEANAIDQQNLTQLPLEGRNAQALQQQQQQTQQLQTQGQPQQQLPQQALQVQQAPPAPQIFLGGAGSGAARGAVAVKQAKPAAVALGSAVPMQAGNGAAPGAAAPPAPQAPVAVAQNFKAPPPPPRPKAAPPATAPAPVAAASVTTADSVALAVDPENNASTTVISGAALDALSDDGSALNGLAKAALRSPLPSHLAALSVVAAGTRTLALDTGNTLFFSEDGGMHWKRVQQPWQGHAVRVDLAAKPIPTTAATPSRPLTFSARAVAPAKAAAADGASAASPGGAAPMLSGTVTDPSGASVPRATVNVTNVATGTSIALKTDAAGHYAAAQLAPGAYQIDVAAPGFKAARLNVTVATQPAVANVTLAVGAVSQSVVVSSGAAPIELEQATPDESKVQSKAKKKTTASAPAAPVFAITTDAGARWVSSDGQTWTRQ